jgi:hypothetical protein
LSSNFHLQEQNRELGLHARGLGDDDYYLPPRLGARRLLLGSRARGLGDNHLTIAMTALHSSDGPSGSSRLCTQGPVPHTDDREFEGWPIEGFDSRSWTPERGAVRDGPQRSELRRTSAVGILNYIRVLLKNEVMVFPPAERRRAAESNQTSSVTR